MPLIDLKNCTIRLRDGYSEAGAINNGGGYMAGVTTILVDAITGIVPVSAIFTFAGLEKNEYTVISTIETAGNTTSITFTPALVATVADNAVLNIGGRSLNIKIGDGNLSYSESKTREFKLDRGLIDQVRNGDEVPVDVSTQLMYEEITAASTSDIPTVEDVLKRRGNASDWENASTQDPCRPFSVNLEILHNPAGCTEFEKELTVLREFLYEKLDHDLKAGTIAMTGKSNSTEAVVTRIAA